jgi:predicted dinucleotide-binding enzyme
MTTAFIGTGRLGSVIARELASGGETLRLPSSETLRLSSADNESARTLALTPRCRLPRRSKRQVDTALWRRRSVEGADRQRRAGLQEAIVEPKTVQTFCLPSVVALSNP